MKIIDGFRLRNIMGQNTIIGEGLGQVDFNKLITLNESAAYLWQSVENQEFDVHILAELLVEKYGIEHDVAVKDAQTIVEQWIEVSVVKG